MTEPIPDRAARTARLRTLRLPALAALLLVAAAVGSPVARPVQAAGPQEAGLCLPETLPGHVCLENIRVCDGEAADPRGVCGITFGPDEVCPTGIQQSRSNVVVCGTPVPVGRCESDLQADPPVVCGQPIPGLEPCADGNAACDALERCLGNAKLAAGARGQAADDDGSPTICGTPVGPVDVCATLPSACKVITDCLGPSTPATTYAAKSYGDGISVCGVDVDECIVLLVCSLDCLEAWGGATYAGNSPPGSVTICGQEIDLPCEQPVSFSPLSICGKEYDPCQGAQAVCSNECVEPLLGQAAALGFQKAYTQNPKPLFAWQPPSGPPDKVCGLNVPDVCDLLNGSGAAYPGPTFQGFGRYSLVHFLRPFEGRFNAAEVGLCEEVECEPGSGDVYHNLDCKCEDAPRGPDDLDGDRAKNWDDVDDDCDALVDVFEDHLYSGTEFDRNMYDMILDMSPYSDAPVEVRFGVKNLGVYYDLDPWPKDGWVDPFLEAPTLCIEKAGCDGTPFLEVPGFNRVTHPHDVGTGGWTTTPVPGSDWGVESVSFELPRLWDDPAYAWRSGTGLSNEMPRLDVGLKLWDHDCDDPDCETDDFIGIKKVADGVGYSFLEIANLVASSFNPGSPVTLLMPLDENGDGIKDVALGVQLAMNTSRCAVDWAYKYANGNLEIDSASTVSGASASLSQC